MSISALLESPTSTVARWRRLVAVVLAPIRVPARSGGEALGRQASHDIRLNRMHRDSPRGHRRQASIRELHARAERLAAGLPE